MEENFKRCGEDENVCSCKSEKECGYSVPDHALEDEGEYCDKCQSEKTWEDCWSCGGEGGRGYEDDLQFEDPLWYEPGDFETCDICGGKGGYYLCPSSKCRGEG